MSLHGDPAEQKELLAALRKHCTCVYDDSTGACISSCAGHLALATDQRFVDGVRFGRHRRASILLEEHGPQTGWARLLPYRHF